MRRIISAKDFEEASIVLSNHVMWIDAIRQHCQAGNSAAVKTMIQRLSKPSVPFFLTLEFRSLDRLFVGAAMEGGGVVSVAGFCEASAHAAAVRLVEEFHQQVTGMMGRTSPDESRQETFQQRTGRMAKWPVLKKAIGVFPSFDREYLLARLEQERLCVAAVLRAPTTEKLTEPLNQQELGKIFCVHRNQVKATVLDKYPHEQVGQKFRLPVAIMPPTYTPKARGT